MIFIWVVFANIRKSWLQVWWEAVPLRSKVIGYEVFFSMTAVEVILNNGL